MPVYKELDPEIALKVIEGYSNALAPEATSLDAFYRQFQCPRCKCSLSREYDSRHAFSDPDSLVARALLRCSNCRYLIDPHTRIVLESGDASKIPLEPIPILGTK